MPGRITGIRSGSRRLPAVALLALLLGGNGTNAAGQQPGSEPRDDRSPRPTGELTRAVNELKYRIPNRDRAIFQGHRDSETGKVSGGIVDLEPIADEVTNKLEYDAWHEVVLHASQFSSRDLEEHAGKEATRGELTGKSIPYYRLELLRFDGWLTKIRRFPATKSLQKSGTLEMYEAILTPLDEPPSGTVSIVFTELPDALNAVRNAPQGEWIPVDRWGAGAGYFFKAVQDAPGARPIPVLVGKSVRLLAGPPEGSDPANPAAIDKSLRVFRSIRNDAPMSAGEENWEEGLAWNRVLLHAHRYSAEELERYARTDLTFFDLYNDGRSVDLSGQARYDGGKRDHKLELVRFEGRLIRLQKMTPTRELRDAGIEAGYEGWLVPRDEPSGNPICIVFTEPVEGVEPGGRINKWVSFAGYVFKLVRYESAEKDRADPNRYVWKRAPLLLGKGVIVRPDPDRPTPVSWRSFMTSATVVILSLIGAALALSWWYRRGDRPARHEIEALRARNPFGEVDH